MQLGSGAAMTRSHRKHAVALLLLAFHLVLVCMSFPEESKIIRTKNLLNHILDKFEGVVEFYEIYAKKMNLDGIFGSRVAEAQLRGYLKRSTGLIPLNNLDEEFEKIQLLQKRLEKATDKSLCHVSKSQPEYFKNMGFLLDKNLWETRRGYRTFDEDIFSKLPQQKAGSLTEKESDLCISELNDQCSISDGCLKIMSAPGSFGYSTTHQLLYFIIGEKLGCYTKLANLTAKTYNQSVEQIKEILCATIFKEASSIVNNQFPITARDLFMEQVFVCGIEGHKEFFEADWIINILAWQKSNGCYGFKENPTQKRRFQRESRTLTKFCESHATAVAIAAISQYIICVMDILTFGGV